MQEEVRTVAHTLAHAVLLHRAGKYERPDQGPIDPNPKWR
jgi:hypothetical protein